MLSIPKCVCALCDPLDWFLCPWDFLEWVAISYSIHTHTHTHTHIYKSAHIAESFNEF